MSPLLLHLGHNNYVVSNRIQSIMPVVPSQPLVTRRIRSEAKEEGKLINCSQGKAARCVLLLSSGHIILCSKDFESLKKMVGGEAACVLTE